MVGWQIANARILIVLVTSSEQVRLFLGVSSRPDSSPTVKGYGLFGLFQILKYMLFLNMLILNLAI